jgi:phage terminase large subunit GpA-like protein
MHDPLRLNFRDSLKYVAPRLVSTWSEQRVFLPQGSNAQPGRWRAIPYQTEIMDCANDKGIRVVVVRKSTRVGYTRILTNVIGHHIEDEPCPMMLVQPSIDDAREYSKDELDKMFSDIPELRALVSEMKGRNAENTILRKEYPSGPLYVIGANSPRGFRRKTVKLVFFDEVDGYPYSAGLEGDQIKLGTRRTDTFWDAQIWIGSTPTITGQSRIDAEFENSDQRFYNVPCPLCDAGQVLKWGDRDSDFGIKWPKGAPEKAYYLCEHCHKPIDHGYKRQMVEQGQWIATKPFNGTAGFDIWAAYSYAPGAAWGAIAREWVEAKGDPLKVQVHVNTIQGKSFAAKGDAPDWEKLWLGRDMSYKRNTIPKGGLILVAAADVQNNRIEVEIQAYGRNFESWSIDSRVIWGDPKLEATWDELTKIYSESFTTVEGYKLSVRMLAVDSGAFTTYVYNWARKMGPTRAMAIKGRNKISILSRPELIDYDFGGRTVKNGVQLWTVGINIVKSELYQFLKLNRNPGELTPWGFKHYPDYDQDYFKQLTAESLQRIKGKWIWFCPPGQANEKLDLNVYCRAVAEHLQLSHFQPQHWDSLEKDLAFFRDSQKKPQQKQADSKQRGVVNPGILRR